jgi:hypothetical protein
MRILLTLYFLFLALPTLASETSVVNLETRPGVTVQIYVVKTAKATATVVLLTGGSGGIGMKNGSPTSPNFLVRSRDYFVAHGLNAAVLNKPSDQSDLDYSFRVSSEHIEDIRKTVVYLKNDTGLPVWLVGTSRGTISATAAAIAFGNEELAGIVLTSSVTSQRKTGAIPYQKLDAIRIPVLVLHHAYDECKVCVPGDASLITKRLVNSPVKKLIYVKGGAHPTGDPCEPMHWHGYVGMEKEAVDMIADWITTPAP